MKKAGTTFLLTLIIACWAATPVLAQNEGEFRSRASGNWNQAQNWERFDGSAWRNVGAPPTGSEVVTIRTGDSLFVNVAVTITGRIVNRGRVVTDTGLLTIGDGGVYQHDLDAGFLPLANWAEGSTLHLTGTVATAPADRNQSYYHIIFDTPGLAANRDMSLDGVTIGGDIIVRNTGMMRWHLTSAPAGETRNITIQGDVIVEQGQFTVHGTSNPQTNFIIDHHGDIDVRAGNFSISRGSQGFGTTVWNLHGGNFSMANATTQNSTNPPTGARFVFMGGETQQLTLGAGNTIQNLPIEVRNGTTLDMGQSRLAGGGHFLLEAGSILGTALPGGVSPIFADVAGVVTLEDNSGYLFNGTQEQVTSGRMPTIVGDLIINNATTVTLSQQTTINGVLRLQAGMFDNTVSFDLGPDGSISMEGGQLLVPVSIDEEAGIPSRFFVDQNYPNPFNPATTIRFGVPSHSAVTITVYNALGQPVLTAFDGNVMGGVHQVAVDLSNLSSGVYLYRVKTDFNEMTRRMTLVK
jgi:hypothetical protein